MDRDQIEKRSYLSRIHVLEQEQHEFQKEKHDWLKERQSLCDQVKSLHNQQSEWWIERRSFLGRISLLEQVICSLTDEMGTTEQETSHELTHGTKIRFRYRGVTIDGIVKEMKKMEDDRLVFHLHEGDWENSLFRHSVQENVFHLGDVSLNSSITCLIHGEEKKGVIKEIKHRSEKAWLRQLCLYVE